MRQINGSWFIFSNNKKTIKHFDSMKFCTYDNINKSYQKLKEITKEHNIDPKLYKPQTLLEKQQFANTKLSIYDISEKIREQVSIVGLFSSSNKLEKTNIKASMLLDQQTTSD